jgi:branched-chain amino acid transport system ATP-binding protein
MSADEIILSAQGLAINFNGFTAVKDVNLDVRRGSIHAVIGPNGAGKTTLFNMLTRFLSPTRGKILFDGRDISRESPAQLARSGMVRSFQISAVFPTLTVMENVRVALQRPEGLSLKFWRSKAVLDHLNERACALLDEVGLGDSAGITAGSLSYGRKRALEIATTLALDPRLILLDEPMAGMGAEDIERTAHLIKHVAADRTVVMIEHNLKVVESISDIITVLRRGEVLAEGKYADVSRHPGVIEAYLGQNHD